MSIEYYKKMMAVLIFSSTYLRIVQPIRTKDYFQKHNKQKMTRRNCYRTVAFIINQCVTYWFYE